MGQDVRTVMLLAVLTGTAGLVLARGRAVPWRAPATALLRAVLQLGTVAAVLGAAVAVPAVVVPVLAVMAAAVAVTAGRRLGGGRHVRDVAVASLAGAVPVASLVLVSGALRGVDPLLVVAVAGIVLGGTMTACTLTGRRLQAAVRDRWPEVEAALALGARPRQAVSLFAPEVVREALVPVLDQTRTTGLVTLPGAFVGALAGGATPVEAARFQVVVLAALLAAQAVAATVLVRRLAVADLLRPPAPASAPAA